MDNNEIQDLPECLPDSDQELLDKADAARKDGFVGDVENVADVMPNHLAQRLEELMNLTQNFYNRIHFVAGLHDREEFKLLSKKSRNNLILGMLDEVGELEALTKATFRQLKKVKRERVPEDKIDELLGVPEEIRNAVRNKNDEESDD